MNSDYAAQVRAELGDASRAELDAVADLRAAIEELGGADHATVVAEFGTPQEYAARLRDALRTGTEDAYDPADPADPDAPAPVQARVLGMPLETRGLTEPRVRARVWDPTNPALFVPRVLGGGWTVNLGALAVRLGLLRPDDVDPDVVAHIPPGAARAARAAPVVLSAATCLAVAASWRRLPARVPTSWSVTGRVQRMGGRGTLAALTALGVAPALWSLRPQGDPPGDPGDAEDALVRAGIGTSLATVTALVVAATLLDADRAVGERGPGARLVPALFLAPLTGLITIVLPVRAGLRRVWDEEVGS